MDIASKPTLIHFYKDRDEDGRSVAVVFVCRMKWDDLERTESDLVRHCTNCSQMVFQVGDINDFERAVAARRCVMVKPAPGQQMVIGEPRRPYLHQAAGALKWDDHP